MIDAVLPQNWHDVIALESQFGNQTSEHTLRQRYQKYPQGFLMAWCQGQPAGLLTFAPIRYTPTGAHRLHTWGQITNQGRLHEPDADANALYIVSGVFRSGYQGYGVFEAAVEAVKEAATAQNYEWVVTGSRLPGYAWHVERHGATSVRDYVALEDNGEPCDPLLKRYRKLGFQVLNNDHIKADFYPDKASLDHAALVACPVATPTLV